jgi:hypothetical protein
MAYIESKRPISAVFVDLVNQFTELVRKKVSWRAPRCRKSSVGWALDWGWRWQERCC